MAAPAIRHTVQPASRDRSDPAGPCVLVIFGAGGDLAKRLLFPALYNLAVGKLLPEAFAVVGFARTRLDDEAFRRRMREAIVDAVGDDVDLDLVEWLVARTSYVHGDFNMGEAYERLSTKLLDVDREHGTQGNYLFYFAIAPEFFQNVAGRLAAAGLTAEQQGRWRRLVIEKPFGHDLASALALNRSLTSVVDDAQIYRIDHYLGKETVQNIMVFRFANGMFEPIWNRRYVDHVQITVAETVGVETRGGYYDQTGALRDMVPNHLLQLLTLTAMEPPSSLSPDALHNEQAKVLQAVPPPSVGSCEQCAVRGQYTAGTVKGAPVPGYRDEPQVDPDSRTETFVALELAIDNWRWAGVPFFLRTGKHLPRRRTEVIIQFRQAPLRLFTRASVAVSDRLVMSIQPEESISLEFSAKVPGPVVTVQPVAMRFCYQDYFGLEHHTGYETLLYDAMTGDSSLFKRADIIEAGWAIVDPVIEAWRTAADGPEPYTAGSDGPRSARALLERSGREWRPLG
jgi:glucose-6-phosphate 1-dehydrogenase